MPNLESWAFLCPAARVRERCLLLRAIVKLA